MTIEEITKLEKQLFLSLSQLFSENIYTVDFSAREVRTSYHRMSFAMYGKYNSYITLRPSLTLISDRISNEVCNIFDIDDDICFHSLFSKHLIEQNSEKVFNSYPDGFIFIKISSQEDIDKMIFNIEAFMANGGSELINKTYSLEGIESFLNKRISKFSILELGDPLIKKELRKFYKDPRIIRSGLISRYITEKETARQLAQQYQALFEGVEVIIKSCNQITSYYDQLESDPT